MVGVYVPADSNLVVIWRGRNPALNVINLSAPNQTSEVYIGQIIEIRFFSVLEFHRHHPLLKRRKSCP